MLVWLFADDAVDCSDSDCSDMYFAILTPIIVFLTLNVVWIHCVDFEALDYNRWSIYTLKLPYSNTLYIQHYIIAENGEIRNALTEYPCCGCQSAKPIGPYQMTYIFLYGICYILLVGFVAIGIEEMKPYF